MTAKQVLESIKSLRQDVQNFMQENQLKELQETLRCRFSKAQKELEGYIGKDIPSIKKKFLNDKKQLQKIVDKMINAEIKKAKTFISKQKKEIEKLQRRIDKLVKQSKSKIKKKAKSKPKKRSTRKSVSSPKRKTAKKASPRKPVASLKVNPKVETTAQLRNSQNKN